MRAFPAAHRRPEPTVTGRRRRRMPMTRLRLMARRFITPMPRRGTPSRRRRDAFGGTDHDDVPVHRHGAVLDALWRVGSAIGARDAVALFIVSGDLRVEWAIRVDALTAVMLVVVTTVSAFVHLYSIGYMEEDPYQLRFFAYFMFTFAMLMLVTADNLLQMFFGKASGSPAIPDRLRYHKPERTRRRSCLSSTASAISASHSVFSRSS